MKLLIALGFLIAVSASPLADLPSKDDTVTPIEDFTLLEQLSEEDEIKKTSEIILEAIIASFDKIQSDIIEGDIQKINEGIQNILNTIQNILKNRSIKEINKEFKENGQAQDKIRAVFMLDDSQQDQYDGNQLEHPQDSTLAQEKSEHEKKLINNENNSDKALDTEQNKEDPSKVKFIDMVPQKKVSDEAQSIEILENNVQTEDN